MITATVVAAHCKGCLEERGVGGGQGRQLVGSELVQKLDELKTRRKSLSRGHHEERTMRMVPMAVMSKAERASVVADSGATTEGRDVVEIGRAHV